MKEELGDRPALTLELQGLLGRDPHHDEVFKEGLVGDELDLPA